MSFNKKTWVDREAQYPVRRQLTKLSEGTDGQGRDVYTVDVTRAEGTITSQGDAFSATNMNDLEERIEEATIIDNALSSTSENALQNKEVNAAIVAALSKLAPTDLNGATAGSAHASGQYIIYGTPAAPKFGKTKAAISVGDTFNSGTGGNITDEDIATELTELNSALTIKDITSQCTLHSSIASYTKVYKLGSIVMITLVVDANITASTDYYPFLSLPTDYRILNNRIAYFNNAGTTSFTDLSCNGRTIRIRNLNNVLYIGTGTIYLFIE